MDKSILMDLSPFKEQSNLAQPVTSRKDWMTSMNKVGMAGGQQGLASQAVAPVREHPS